MEESHQAEAAGEYWCQLLHEHRGEEELDARRTLFERWPRLGTANRLHAVASGAWPPQEADVLVALAARPDDYIEFPLETLHNVPLAWTEAHRLDLARTELWDRLIAAYQVHDPVAVLPVLESIVEAGLTVAEVRNYKMAVARLRKHRAIAAVAGRPEATAGLVASLRERNRNRPRLLRELDRVKF
ncbi:hypothetical protein [Arthrobacter glacialis]|uniref:hypothetical protein n=1 Tax=Arthrobacter glacialis TaxID=1664 RepID=UPI001056E4F6|nr:hypothetical protein [Arthrobacter glacialis]